MNISLEAYNCLTPAGEGVAPLLRTLHSGETRLRAGSYLSEGALGEELHETLAALRAEKALREQDTITLMAVYLARSLRLSESRQHAGVVLGSSRGPTGTLEKLWEKFQADKPLPPSASPSSTASSLTAAVARDLGLQGPSFFVSAACSTGLTALIQGASLITSGLADEMLVGGAEASLTDFTRSLLKSTRVVSRDTQSPFPCRPGEPSREGMVLSEGAALLHLRAQPSPASRALITGLGMATESAGLTGVSEQGDALVMAIERALNMAHIGPEDIDLIVGHGAGTQKGDAAELAAYHRVFPSLPVLVWHKWCTGHMLGASAALSVILAAEHLRAGQVPPHPYFPEGHLMHKERLLSRKSFALVTGLGFGGSACAVIVKNQALAS